MFSRFILAVVAALVLAVGFAAPAEARWLRAESPRFIFYGDSSEGLIRQYAEKMEVFDSLMRSLHGLPEDGVPGRKLPIYLVRSRDALQKSWFGASDMIAGYYSPGSADTFAVATTEDRDDDTTLFHEYAHHFMLQNFPGAYPAWMVEGYAEYYGATEIDAQYVRVGGISEMRNNALLNGKWLPLADVLANKRAPNQWDAFYAQSWLLTHYLMSDPERMKRFQAYGSLVARGGDPVQSMAQATGLSIEALEAELRKYVRGGLKITQYKRTKVAKPVLTFTTLPPSADDFLLERIQIVSHHFKDAPPNYLETMRKRAAKYPGDQLALLTLAQAELELGDKAVGRKLLTDWIAANPNDAEALFVLGDHLNSAYGEEEDAAKAKAINADAQKYLAQAVAAAPNDYKVLYAYAQARRSEPGFPTADTMNLLVKAYRLAPQVVPLRFELVQVLMARGHLKEARALLQPLLNSPHGGEVVAAAKKLLERIEAMERRAG